MRLDQTHQHGNAFALRILYFRKSRLTRTGTKSAPGLPRGRVQLGDRAFGNRISEVDKNHPFEFLIFAQIGTRRVVAFFAAVIPNPTAFLRAK